MFGTLMHEPERRPLMFVENTDISSALSRNRRDKPRISCELCRSRKVRCGGQTPSCDRCSATGAKCKYLSREARRKKTSVRRKTESPAPEKIESNSNDDEEEGHQSREEDGVWEELPVPKEGNSPKATTQVDAIMNDTDPEFDDGHNVPENILASYWMADGIAAKSMEGNTTYFGDGMMESIFGDSSDPSIFDDDFAQNGSDFTIESIPQSWNISPYEGQASRKHSPRSREDAPRAVANRSPLRQPSHNPSPRHWSGGSPSISNKHRQVIQEESRRNTLPDSHKADLQKKEGCRCLHITARLIEELGAKSANSDPVAIDVLLGDFRKSLVNCASILDCDRCTSTSETNMLLAMAGRYMSTLFERIVKSYLELQRWNDWQPPWPSQPNTIRDASAVDEGRGAVGKLTGDMWFSTYRIEGGHERAEVLRCLVTVQLSEFCRLLDKLKTRSGSRKGHMVLLSEAEGRTRAAVTLLQTSGGSRTDKRSVMMN